MPEYLLISGRDAVSVAYMPAVAADIISKIKDAQVDIAAPTAYADYARISAVVRRVHFNFTANRPGNEIRCRRMERKIFGFG